MDEEWLEGSIESRGAENGEYDRETCSLMNMEGIGTADIHQKGGKSYKKKGKGETIENHLLDDGGEACSGTEEGLNFSLKEKVDIDVTNAKQNPPRGRRKRNKKLFSGGNSVTATRTHANCLCKPSIF